MLLATAGKSNPRQAPRAGATNFGLWQLRYPFMSKSIEHYLTAVMKNLLGKMCLSLDDAAQALVKYNNGADL